MDRFFRGANAVNVQGTGLGLHIVSKYVECMQGKLTYESVLNEGTTFTIIFKPSILIAHQSID
jgi:signal transduction histidine kinase